MKEDDGGSGKADAPNGTPLFPNAREKAHVSFSFFL
jgi:hypothetical protein